MDDFQSLDALTNIMNELAEKPFDFAAHVQHVRLSKSLPGMEAEAASALEMMSEFLAVGDEVWLPLLDAKEKSFALETEDGLMQLFALYDRAEADYLSIPILLKHLEFVIERHSHYASEGNLRPECLGTIFTTAWTRKAIDLIVGKGLIHLTESWKLWDIQRNWEMQMLGDATHSEKLQLVEHVQNLFLLRLRQIHSNMEDTFQAYSTFTTNYLPSHDYEKLLVSASKMRAQTVRNWERREPLESKLVKTQCSLEGFNEYILYERRARNPDIFVTRGIYERAIAEAAKRRFNGEQDAEKALQVFWTGYCDALRTLDVGINLELTTFRRAVRSVPGSGEVWARYIRFLERLAISGESFEELETVADVFDRAINTKIIQQDINQIIPLILARASYEKHLLEAGNNVEDNIPTLIGVLENGIAMARQTSRSIDPSLRLEKFLAAVYESSGLVDEVFDMWKAAAKHSKSSYQVWLHYTESLIKHSKFDEVRQVFIDIHTKQIDWPEAIWDAWASFEHIYGSVTNIEDCLIKIEKAQYQTNSRRAKEAERVAYQTMEVAASAPVDDALIFDKATGVDVAMQVDSSVQSSERGTKRAAAAEDPEASGHKKARMEEKLPLKRDREHCEVFVADLPDDVTEDDLRLLFKDCGAVRETKITRLPSGLVATVEFTDRDSIPAALTKDKKRLHNHQISVHLAWKSTLYVTNFPESADDLYIRNLFGKYGTIFDVRWPSKKFKSSRRFCYIQFTSPVAAEKALQLHGHEIEPNFPVNVYISNPERKKDRSDHDANEKELYIAGLSKFTSKTDLEKVFATYGTVKDIRLAMDDNGHAKGYAFVEYTEASEAYRALSANNYELKKRRIAVTLADSRVGARHKSDIGLSRSADARSRSIYVRNIPPATQEGLLQQEFEKIARVKRVEVFLDRQEAVVELQNQVDVGRLLLRTEPILFGGKTLELSEDMPTSRMKEGTAKNVGPALFKPRNLGPSKPKAGLGFKKSPIVGRSNESSSSAPPVPISGAKGQDDFRKMLEK